jgi:hypothetical protein
MSARDVDDWPTVALAISEAKSRAVAVWTQDQDFEVSGLPTITTGALLDILEGTHVRRTKERDASFGAVVEIG